MTYRNKFIFACIANSCALVLAEREIFQEGVPVEFPGISNGDVSSTGRINEVMIVERDGDGEDADEIIQVWLYATWRTGTTAKNTIYEGNWL